MKYSWPWPSHIDQNHLGLGMGVFCGVVPVVHVFKAEM